MVPGRVNWTSSQNLHVTMNFLGDVPNKRVDELCDLAREAVGVWEPGSDEVAFTVGQLICFPRGRQPRMIWAPVRKGNDLLASLHGVLNQAIEAAGWRGESRPFTGHVTVARIKDCDIKDAVGRLPDEELGAVTAGELTLYESNLTHTGPVYSRLAGIPLSRRD
jgi:2'-5' RNA ligase